MAWFAQQVPGCRLLDGAGDVNATAYLLGTLRCRVTGTDYNDSASAEGDLLPEALREQRAKFHTSRGTTLGLHGVVRFVSPSLMAAVLLEFL